MEELKIAHFIEKTNVLGPGERCVLWVQGCSRHCPNCIGEELKTGNNGYKITSKGMAERIMNIPNLKGITFSGGEPFLQAKGLIEVIDLLNMELKPTVMIYTGYLLSEILSTNNDEWKKLVFLCDILIDGPYIEELNDGSLWRGSSNQIIYFPKKSLSYKEEAIQTAKGRGIEIHLDQNNRVIIVGIPPVGFLKNFQENLKQSGISLEYLEKDLTNDFK